MSSSTPPRQESSLATTVQGLACVGIFLLCFVMILLVYWGDRRSVGGNGRHQRGADDLESQRPQAETARLNLRRTCLDVPSETTPLLTAGSSDLTLESTVVGSSGSSTKRTDSDLSTYSAVTTRSGASSSTCAPAREDGR